MSSDVKLKLWLLQNERALTAIATKGWAVKVAANVYRIQTSEIQAWLEAYNGGSSNLTLERLLAVKRELGIISEGRAPRDPAPAAAPVPPAVATAPKAAAPKVDFERPWLLASRRPSASAVKAHRPLLNRLAKGEAVSGIAHGPYQFLKYWLGNGRPGKDQVQAFLAWYDGDHSARNTPPPTKTAGSSQPAAERPADSPAAPSAPAPATVARSQVADDFVEIVQHYGAVRDYAARYSGDSSKVKRLGFTAKASAPLKAKGWANGEHVRLFWNAKTRELGIVRAGAGFKLRNGFKGFILAGAVLAKTFGAKPIKFHQLPDRPDFDVFLAAKPEKEAA